MPRRRRRRGRPSKLTNELANEIVHYFQQGMDIPQVAQRLGIPENTVRGWLEAGRKVKIQMEVERRERERFEKEFRTLNNLFEYMRVENAPWAKVSCEDCSHMMCWSIQGGWIEQERELPDIVKGEGSVWPVRCPKHSPKGWFMDMAGAVKPQTFEGRLYQMRALGTDKQIKDTLYDIVNEADAKNDPDSEAIHEAWQWFINATPEDIGKRCRSNRTDKATQILQTILALDHE